MLYYGTAQWAPFFEEKKATILNFSSMVERYDMLRLLPPDNLGAVNEYDFDIRYANLILGSEGYFMEFMRIIMPLYMGNDVYICILRTENPWSEMIMESLLKLIQQRYGYNAARIDSFEDIVASDQSGFSPYGLINLDNDKDRYAYIVERSRLRAGGIPYAQEG